MLSPLSPETGHLPPLLIPNEPKGAHVELASRVVSLAGDSQGLSELGELGVRECARAGATGGNGEGKTRVS